MSWLERRFEVRERGSTPAREVRAGTATFLTMAYILFVNPQILGQAGMPEADVAVATALAAAIGCFAMAWLANYPFALAPGMGLNAYFVFGVVIGLGVSWQVALTAVLIEGVLFLLLSLIGLRSALVDSIPMAIKQAIPVGIGLFLAVLGLRAGGVVVIDGGNLTLGELGSAAAMLTLLGVVVMGLLQTLRVPGALVLVIVTISAISWMVGAAPPPAEWMVAPRIPSETLFAFDLGLLGSGALWGAVAALLMVDLLDTAGTLIGVGHLGGFLDQEGRLPRADRAFAADALATIAGACLGTSTTTTYIESAAGVEEGGRTGLTAVAAGFLFLLALVFAPVFTAVPPQATAPALIAVGAMMMRGAVAVDWARPDEALPAFLCVTLMPLTSSIAHGIAGGLVSWVLIRWLSGRGREVAPLAWAMTAAVVVFFVLLRA